MYIHLPPLLCRSPTWCWSVIMSKSTFPATLKRLLQGQFDVRGWAEESRTESRGAIERLDGWKGCRSKTKKQRKNTGVSNKRLTVNHFLWSTFWGFQFGRREVVGPIFGNKHVSVQRKCAKTIFTGLFLYNEDINIVLSAHDKHMCFLVEEILALEGILWEFVHLDLFENLLCVDLFPIAKRQVLKGKRC